MTLPQRIVYGTSAKAVTLRAGSERRTTTFNPNTIPSGSGATTVSIAVSVPTTVSVKPLDIPFGNQSLPIALGVVLMPLAFRYRKSGRKLRRSDHALIIAIAAVAITVGLAVGLSGCGGGSTGASSGGNPTTRTYPLTLTASAGAHTQTTTLTLVVK
jgi:hypothetical protein